MSYPQLGESPRSSLEKVKKEQQAMESTFEKIAFCEDDIVKHDVDEVGLNDSDGINDKNESNENDLKIIDETSSSSFLYSMFFAFIFIIFVIFTESVMK